MDRGLNIIFEWVPAHVGIVGNEKADFNAKKSLQDGTVGLNINYNFKEIGSLATSFLTILWQQEWNTRRNLHHHNLQPLVSKTTQTHQSRKLIKIITRLRVGLVRGLGDTKFKIKQIGSPDCQICHTKDTVRHFLLECVKYNKERGFLLAEFGSLGIKPIINNILNPPNDIREVVNKILF